MTTDVDYQSHCIFIDPSAFHNHLSRSMAWSTKRTRAVVVQRQKRLRQLFYKEFLCIVNMKGGVPYEESSKKSERGAKGKEDGRNCSWSSLYFISAALDILGRHEPFKGHCLIMANDPIHNSDQIAKLIASRVYLPPYSPGLNLIEPF